MEYFVINTSLPVNDAVTRTSTVPAKIANSSIFNLFFIRDFIIQTVAINVGTSIKNASFGAYKNLSGAFVRFVSTGEK